MSPCCKYLAAGAAALALLAPAALAAAPPAVRILGPQEKALVGTWRFTPRPEQSTMAQTIEFRQDGTFVRTLGPAGAVGPGLRQAGTFRYEGNVLTTRVGGRVRKERLFQITCLPDSVLLAEVEFRKVD